MSDVPDQTFSSPTPQRRQRPARRPASRRGEDAGSVLTPEFAGMAAAYGNTLLFIGFEVNGLVEITVYPRYRFSSDDRVQGHLGYVRIPYGTGWDEILEAADRLHDHAQTNYRIAVSTRAAETRSHGAAYDTAYESIAEAFRESWHGFALRLQRVGSTAREGIVFEGSPPEPVLATWRGQSYTVHVFETGSILIATGDRRKSLQVKIRSG